LAWVAYELLYDDPSSWVVAGGEDDAKFALFYEHLIRTLAFTGLGALILTVQPRNKAGLLCLAPVSTPIVWSLPYPLPTWVDSALTSANFALAYFIPFAILPLFLPNGRLPHSAWRLVLWFTTLAITAQVVLGVIWWEEEVLPAEVDQLYEVLARALVFGTYAALLSLLHRLLLTRSTERARVMWIALAVWAAYLGRASEWYLAFFVGEPSGFAMYLARVIGLMGFIVACGVAILRHDLVVLNPLLRRLLLAVVLVTVLAGCYLGLRAVLGDEPVPAAVTAVGLALVSPVLYRWLRGGVTRLVYGRRGSPADMTAALTRRMATAAGPSEVLAGLADAIQGAVPVMAVRVVLTSPGRELLRVTRGTPDITGVTTTVPLTFQGAELGVVDVVGSRPVDQADRALLVDLAAAASAAVAAAHRSSELQRAHQELITAREQERRRIARDLHDGVGPVLSGLGFTLDSLRGSVHDPDAERVTGQARGQVREAVQLVRRVARELRPPGVDQLGLVGALRELAARHTGPALTVRVSAGDLGELCAATEVAAHAIVAEAITNTARHARASRCDITMDRGQDGLTVVVQDNGIGLGSAAPGVGRASMIERAEELGGRCDITTEPSGGTLVHAFLPVHVPDPINTARTIEAPAR
jgi:signal transduction histidine kinase